MRAFLLGVVVTLTALALLAFGVVQTGAVPARQDIVPGKLESWAAHTSLDATIEREAPKPPYPYGPPTEADFVAGATLYVQNCSVCHGTAHTTPNAIARGFAVKAPQFAKHSVEDDSEGETYWKIEHGIRMTAMPSFSPALDERSIWQITYMMKHLSTLPPKAAAIWQDPKLAPPPTPMPAIPGRDPGEAQMHG
jgi:mono/diheme cytochrome c family protein